MKKILPTGEVACLTCGDELDGVLIDYQTERNELEPDCELCNV